MCGKKGFLGVKNALFSFPNWLKKILVEHFANAPEGNFI